MQTGVDLNLEDCLHGLDKYILKKTISPIIVKEVCNVTKVNAKADVNFGSSLQDQYIKIISREHIVN